MINQAQLDNLLQRVKAPFSDRSLLEFNALKEFSQTQDVLTITLCLNYPAQSELPQLETQLTTHIKEQWPEISKVDITWQLEVKAEPTQNSIKSLQGVKNIIAVASGKGGVGKSTTTVNLALAMAQQGAVVGLLDADIYGPSQGLMLGLAPGTRPDISAQQQMFLPIKAHGIQAMSMAFVVDENTPMVWRGPMVSSALQQLLSQTLWQKLDYLFVDMPPGTGDIQLTLSQRAPLSGSVVVTTPQDIALLDAVKGIEMFAKVDVPVLGIVENMSYYQCPACGEKDYIFGEGGGERIAAQYKTNLLGSLPLMRTIREQADGGQPTVVADPDGEVAQIYRSMASKIGEGLARRSGSSKVFPKIVIQND